MGAGISISLSSSEAESLDRIIEERIAEARNARRDCAVNEGSRPR